LSRSTNCILVVVDKFIKYAHFLSLKHPFTAASVARLFLDFVYKLHCLPLSIILDKDRVFTSKFWTKLFHLAKVQLRMYSAYHLQSDSQIEWVNQYLEMFLRYFVKSYPKQWSHWIPLAQFWYNTSHHSAIGRSPFEALYGRSPQCVGVTADVAAASTDLEKWLQDHQVITTLIKQHLQRDSHRMKQQADKGRLERVFQEGGMVFLKLQLYVQSSLTPRANQKLTCKFFAPLQDITESG
jgi:hypothetical protein